MNGVDARHVRQVPGVDDPSVVELADGRAQQARTVPRLLQLEAHQTGPVEAGTEGAIRHGSALRSASAVRRPPAAWE